MSKKVKTIKENSDIRIEANLFIGDEGKKEFFTEVMEKVRTLVNFYLSLKVSATFASYSNKHNVLSPNVKFEVMMKQERGDIRYLDNIEPNKRYSDEDFLFKVMEKLAEYVFIIVTKSDTVFDDLLKLLGCTQGVLISDTVICINGEPVVDDFTGQASEPRNATLN